MFVIFSLAQFEHISFAGDLWFVCIPDVYVDTRYLSSLDKWLGLRYYEVIVEYVLRYKTKTISGSLAYVLVFTL